MKNILAGLFLLIFSLGTVFVTNSASKDDKLLKISNDKIERIISIENGKIATLNLHLTDYDFNFVAVGQKESEEFSFLLNEQLVTGKTGWNIAEIQEVTEGAGKGSCVFLQGSEEINKNIKLQITYITYPDLPIIRKKITIINQGDSEIRLDNIDTELLSASWGNTNNVVYRNYGRYRHLGPYIGDWDDPAVIVHEERKNRGIVLGNEAPGVTKRTSSFLDGKSISIGLCHLDQEYPCRVWLSPNEKWESPWTFIALYNDSNPRNIIDGPINDFVRNYMGIRLAQISQRPTFVYNTWIPFLRNINDKLIRELADAVSACGAQEFVIDDGWQVGYGDWEIDYEKFPEGLKPVFDYIKSKGMKPGLWLSMGAASPNSKVYKDHPEWFVRYKDGETINLHSPGSDIRTACFTTGWKDYIKEKILALVREHGLEYVKLDFAIVTSAYIFDRSKSGCYSSDHSHKDREESFLEIYRAAWNLFDELHAEAPDLFIDCTYETMGALQLIDYDMCKHAEGNWLSNFGESAPKGSLRVRQMAWWRSPVIPSTALVIGNQTIDDEQSIFSFKSLTGSLPIMLGDPRQISSEKQGAFRELANWLFYMEKKHQVMLYRQDLPGYGEPEDKQWDGFQRINTDTKSGGIIGVFRQNAVEEERTITVKMLDPAQNYVVREAVTKKVIASMNGDELQTKGFNLTLENKYNGALFEVAKKEDQ